MREMLKMILVLTILSSVSGFVLAGLKDNTKDRIENNELEMVKGPAVRQILEGCSNDPVADRFKVMDGDAERSVFVGVFDGQPNTVAFETMGNPDKKDVLIIGDSLSSDMTGGVNYGIDTCWFNPDGRLNDKVPDITYEVDNLQEVVKIVSG
jgi:electron transport complex protein RnfG